MTMAANYQICASYKNVILMGNCVKSIVRHIVIPKMKYCVQEVIYLIVRLLMIKDKR